MIRVKRLQISFLITFLIVMLFSFSAYANDENSDYDSLIVIPKETTSVARRINYLMRKQGVLNYRKIKNNHYVVPLDNSDKNAQIAKLQASGLFSLVEPDYKFSLDEMNEKNYIKIIKHSLPVETNVDDVLPEAKEITPNDQGFISQYYLREINATKAWGTTVGNSLLVGVLDTGVDASHPDLVGKILTGINITPDDIDDTVGHGTEVAGIIAANTNNNRGIAGVSWNTKILPVKVTDENGQAKVSTVVEALDRAYEKGVKIVQISLSTSQFSQVLKSAVEEAQNKGILIISTGGNTGARELRYPSAFSGVVGVGAVNRSQKIESYSTTGDHISLVAPGASIYTTSLESSYVAVTGTSFAAPQVAGTAALVWSIAPQLSCSAVRDILLKSAEDLGEVGKDPSYGYGLLNTQKAVELAKLQTK